MKKLPRLPSGYLVHVGNLHQLDRYVTDIATPLRMAAQQAQKQERELATIVDDLKKNPGYQLALRSYVGKQPRTAAESKIDSEYFVSMASAKQRRTFNHHLAQPLVRAFKELNRYRSWREAKNNSAATNSMTLCLAHLSSALAIARYQGVHLRLRISALEFLPKTVDDSLVADVLTAMMTGPQSQTRTKLTETDKSVKLPGGVLIPESLYHQAIEALEGSDSPSLKLIAQNLKLVARPVVR